jgi:hypothetical protein
MGIAFWAAAQGQVESEQCGGSRSNTSRARRSLLAFKGVVFGISAGFERTSDAGRLSRQIDAAGVTRVAGIRMRASDSLVFAEVVGQNGERGCCEKGVRRASSFGCGD